MLSRCLQYSININCTSEGQKAITKLIGASISCRISRCDVWSYRQDEPLPNRAVAGGDEQAVSAVRKSSELLSFQRKIGDTSRCRAGVHCRRMAVHQSKPGAAVHCRRRSSLSRN
ncbi:uncharacterized protein LOC127260314 [Andrographis paniculata]|uniref:uncharacterized protein LOC127260314 n=1 Tax=Andrographis paniculata TaxID=175694 RepID=UPI0021E727A8|nr:uncharacterized protein LOC127260314 [Andrographis paniculata]